MENEDVLDQNVDSQEQLKLGSKISRRLTEAIRSSLNHTD